MSTPDLRQLLADHCFTRDLPTDLVDRVVEHARVTTYPPGAWLFREGSTAKEFHLVVSGTVAVSMHVPGRGDHVVDTVDACETVGWSWLVPPYRWFFDARATTEVTAVTIDAVALRTIAEQEPAFGYALLRQVTVVMLERMQAARVRLADLYGPAA